MTTITRQAGESEAIRARRLAIGLTQRQLAARSGYSLTWIANIEAGCVPARSDALGRISAALDEAESVHNDHEPAANGLVGKVAEPTRHAAVY
jgi:predicted transcriptional regulator